MCACVRLCMYVHVFPPSIYIYIFSHSFIVVFSRSLSFIAFNVLAVPLGIGRHMTWRRTWINSTCLRECLLACNTSTPVLSDRERRKNARVGYVLPKYFLSQPPISTSCSGMILVLLLFLLLSFLLLLLLLWPSTAGHLFRGASSTSSRTLKSQRNVHESSPRHT